MVQRHFWWSARGLTYGLVVLSASCWLGCDGDPQGRLPLGGTVAINGTPVAAGTILFVPTGGDRTFTAGGPVQDGKFTIAREKGLPPGEYRATIFSPNEAARPKGNPGEPRPAAPNLLPPGKDGQTLKIAADNSTGLSLEFKSK